MHFDPTINLGSLLQASVLIVGIFKLVGKLASIETKVEAMWADFVQIRNDQ